MNQDAKTFILGLEQSRSAGGMIWHGKIPQQIIDLYDIKISELAPRYTITGVLVETRPQYIPVQKQHDYALVQLNQSEEK